MDHGYFTNESKPSEEFVQACRLDIIMLTMINRRRGIRVLATSHPRM